MELTSATCCICWASLITGLEHTHIALTHVRAGVNSFFHMSIFTCWSIVCKGLSQSRRGQLTPAGHCSSAPVAKSPGHPFPVLWLCRCTQRAIQIRAWRLGVLRFGSMAAAVAEEVLQHVGPDPRAEQANNVAGEDEFGGDDEEILRFMDSADGYLLLMDSLSSVLRQGWFDLASARHSMGASRVSSTLFDHKEQSAATKLQVEFSAELQPSEPNPHFALSKWCLQDESDSSDIAAAQDSTKPKLRHRGSEATPDGSSESDATTAKSSTGADINNQVQSARSKALSVFGALVSPKLRTTQVSFETALELIVELANSRSTMLSSFSKIKHKSGVAS